MSEKVEIIAELKDLISGKMDEITAKVDKLHSSIQKTGQAKGFWNMDTNMMRGVTAGNLLANGITRATTAIWDFEKGSVQAFGNFEQFQTSLTTMFHGNKQKAEILSNQLQQFAKATPFELTEIQEATKMMLAYGSTAGGVVKEMTMLGDISSGVGAPLKDIAYLYGTLRTQGRAYAMDIRQFAGRGIPIIDALAKQFRVSKEEVMKLVEKGKVGFPQVEAALKSLTEQGGQFAGMMNEQSKTLNGQVSNLADGWEQLKVKIGESQSGILKGTISWATEMLNAANAGLDAQNRLLRGIGKTGRGFGFMDQTLMSSDYIKNFAFSEQVNSRFVQPANQSESAAHKAQSEINYTISGIISQLGKGKISGLDFNRQFAILDSARKDVEAIIGNFKENKNGEKGGSAKGKSVSDLEKVAAANRPTQMYITIENLVKDLQVVMPANTPQMTLDKMAELVSRVLTGAVNDLSVLPMTK